MQSLSAEITPSTAKPSSAGRLTLILFFSAFILPVVVAYSLLASGWWSKAGSVNHGTLVEPPLTLEPELHGLFLGARALDSQEKKPWIVLNIMANNCQDSCQNALLLARQTSQLLGPKKTRVKMVVAHTQPLQTALNKQLTQSFSNIAQVQVDSALLGPLASQLPEVSPNRSQNDPTHLLIIDPLGNAMLLHQVSPEAQSAILEGKGFVKDLKRLLKLSRIG